MSANKLTAAQALADAYLQNRRDAIGLFGEQYRQHTRELGVQIRNYAQAHNLDLMRAMYALASQVHGSARLALMVAYVELVAPGGERHQLVQAIFNTPGKVPAQQGGAA